ncbi:GNAT family N-acetyltransferase [Microbacterium sp. C7(2022)]|uniref:GNAT family N-acetyltransferase n=1 Tax=Microbacterium sp. C7(2022) TaxID=2992759 RepID=UPI00237A40A7|nr:GNAT family N-acetyltransferase [Microbacterium sp. C7(2022)]MDE0546682.1 GNAT family N-acetyltransferase [Microbacterium sp. C7(2022)]
MIDIIAASADRFDDIQHALDGGGDGRSCQCQWWTLTNTQFNTTTADERRAIFAHEVASATPGLIAYVDGEPAGWVRIGPRTAQQRLSRTRAFHDATPPWEDDTVWAVTCFVVRREHRNTGLNARLLASTIEFARDNGARVIEAYPIDPNAGKKLTANNLFTGVLSTFEAAGFAEIARPAPHRAIVNLSLA